MREKGFALPSLLLISILVVVLIYGAYNFLIKGSIFRNIQNNTQISTQKSSIPASTAALNYTIPILKDYDSKSFGRNLWLYNEDLKQGKQITSDHEISQLFGLSPDKKTVLVTTINNTENDNNLHEQVSLVDTNNGNIKKLFPDNNVYTSIWKIYWLDNNKIIYALGRQIKSLNILSSSEEVLVDTQKSITDDTVIVFDVSPDKKWLVYYYSAGGEGSPPQQNLNTYALNLETRKQIILFSASDRARYYALNNNFVIYGKLVNSTNQLWKVNYSGEQRELITNLSDGELIYMLSNSLGSKLIYQLRFYNKESAELYLYDFITKQSKMFFKANVADGIREPKISADGNNILFNIAFNKNDPIQFTLVNYNLQTNTQSLLKNQEQSPHTVVVY